MPWDKDPDRAFPTRHPREPGGLRQDILDEIADHLASAAEREAERSNDDEETVWRRVLERFGNPDAIARKLWWDQMRETIMREWIQTGVMIVAAAAVVVGVVFMGVMMARVGTANEAMQAAMKQVAASNEAVLQAMAEQRKGNEAMLKSLTGIQGGGGDQAATLELSTIDIVVRRGTPEGPPAREVRVRMQGKGPGDSSLSVQGELDASGRASFQRLYQGAYYFSFEDPQSRLFSEKTITLFAGKGAGEYVIVAPDVAPRPIHIDWGLPVYARDDEQLIGTVLEASWSHDGFEWTSMTGVLIGHGETRAFSEAAAGLKTWQDAARVFADPGQRSDYDRQVPLVWEQYAPCALAGVISVVDRIVLIQRNDSGDWRPSRDTRLTTSSTQRRPDAEWPVLSEVSDGYFTGTLPEEFFEKYAEAARLARNRERVPDDTYAGFMGVLAAEMPDQIVASAAVPPEVRVGVVTERGIFGVPEPSRRRNMWKIGWDLEDDFEEVFVVAWPDAEGLHRSEDSNAYLAIGGMGIGKARLAHDPPDPGDRRMLPGTNVDWSDDHSGNALVAYAIRTPWRGQEWPTYAKDGTGKGVQLALDPEPFWRIASESIPSGTLYIPVSALANVPGNEPPTGVLLRWEKSNVDGGWMWTAEPSVLVDVDGPEGLSCWMSVEPIANAVPGSDGLPKNDIDGRFHYDKLEPTELIRTIERAVVSPGQPVDLPLLDRPRTREELVPAPAEE